MAKPSGHFYRDASDRLTYEIFDLESHQYAATCRRIARKFGLTPVGELIVGPDEVFREYSDGKNIVGLEWDNWSGFIVVAKHANAEALVRSIAEFLRIEWRWFI